MRRSYRLAVAGALLAAPALAHVGPSPDTNNRYLKLSPLADGVRLSYTVFIGDAPGRILRARLDRNKDALVSTEEAAAFGRELGVEIAAGLALEVDGRAVRVNWTEVEVGLGEPTIAGGSFAVDLVAWLCYPTGQRDTRHVVILRDRFSLPTPGESELKVEESPGAQVLFAGLTAGAPNRDLRWRGAEHPTLGPGYRLEVDVEPSVAIAGGVCGRPPPSESGGLGAWWILVGGLLAAGGALAWRYRKTLRDLFG